MSAKVVKKDKLDLSSMPFNDLCVLLLLHYCVKYFEAQVSQELDNCNYVSEDK